MSSMIFVNIISANALSPTQFQTITWTNADLLPNRFLGTYLSEVLIKLQTF